MIKIEKITCSYNKNQPIFKDLSLELTDKLIFVFGSNGIGKTTLFNCLMGRIPLLAGDIKIEELSITKMSERDRAKAIALVPQNFNSTIEYSVNDFISFGRTPYFNILERPTANDYKIVEQHMIDNNILYLKNKKMNEISGGERHLVYITRAMAQETPIIVMDEPMSALDYDNQAVILQLIKK